MKLLLAILGSVALLSGCTMGGSVYKGTWSGEMSFGELMPRYNSGIPQKVVLEIDEDENGNLTAKYTNRAWGFFGQPLAVKVLGTGELQLHASVWDLSFTLSPGPFRLGLKGKAEVNGAVSQVKFDKSEEYLIPRKEGEVRYRVPEGGIPAEDAGFDEVKITLLIQEIADGKFENVESLLVAQDGKPFVEEYFYGFDAETKHPLRSITKSVLALLTGIAVDQGKIKSVKQPVMDFFPEQRKKKHWNANFEALTIEHLLEMRSGLYCDDFTMAFADSIAALATNFGWSDYVFRKNFAEMPGRSFRYCGAQMTVLGEIIRRASGMPVPEFAATHLYRPLGIEGGPWLISEDGEVFGGYGHSLRPRDMLKLGLLVGRRGRWEDRQVISEEFIRAMVTPRVKTNIEGGRFGYQCWVWPGKSKEGEWPEVVSFTGHGGQMIGVNFSKNTVVVFTGGNYLELLKANDVTGRLLQDLTNARLEN